MEKATDREEDAAKRDEDGASKRRRGPGVSKLSIDRTETLLVAAPAGSRPKGFEEIIVQDLMRKAETARCRRERRETADGERLIAPLPAGIVGGCGPHLIRLAPMLHFQGRMTCERIVALLAGLGLAILKAPGGAASGRQARGFPRRGRSGAAGGTCRRALHHRRRHRRAPCRQGLFHHPYRPRPVRGVPHRAGEIALGFPFSSARRRGALCDQRGGDRLYARR